MRSSLCGIFQWLGDFEGTTTRSFFSLLASDSLQHVEKGDLGEVPGRPFLGSDARVEEGAMHAPMFVGMGPASEQQKHWLINVAHRRTPATPSSSCRTLKKAS